MINGFGKIKKVTCKGWGLRNRTAGSVRNLTKIALRKKNLLKSPPLSIKLSHNMNLNNLEWARLSSGHWRMGTIIKYQKECGSLK